MHFISILLQASLTYLYNIYFASFIFILLCCCVFFISLISLCIFYLYIVICYIFCGERGGKRWLVATWRQRSLTIGSAPGPGTAGKYLTGGGWVKGGRVGQVSWEFCKYLHGFSNIILYMLHFLYIYLNLFYLYFFICTVLYPVYYITVISLSFYGFELIHFE